uniref:Uncharacterized protein n=1 Tax=Arundo donax TaxID=35708 RepID=A0A0A9HG88_ARUDO
MGSPTTSTGATTAPSAPSKTRRLPCSLGFSQENCFSSSWIRSMDMVRRWIGFDPLDLISL